MAKHWTDTDFLNRLYQVGPDDDNHLQTCAECRARCEQWQSARERQLRADAQAEAQVPVEILVRQREAIQARIAGGGARSSTLWGYFWPPQWRSAVGVAAMAVVAVLLWQSPGVVQQDRRAPQSEVVTDAQLMADIYSTAYETEPVTIAPVRQLFEDRQ